MAPSGLNSDLGGGPDQQRGRGLVGFGEHHMTPHRTGRRVVLTGTRHAIARPASVVNPADPPSWLTYLFPAPDALITRSAEPAGEM